MIIISENLMNLYKENHRLTNERAKNCKVFKIKYVKDTNPNRFLFYVVCHESWSNLNGWISSVLFEEAFNETKRDKKKPLNSEVRVKCSCPAFQYWGSAYNSTQLDYNLDINETREPNIRDPKRERKICKHLAAVRFILRNKTFKQMRRLYSSKGFQDLILDEIPWDQTIPSIQRFLEGTGFSARKARQLVSQINEANYVQFLERYEVIVK